MKEHLESKKIEEQIRIAEIIAQSLQKEITEREKLILKEWLNSSKYNRIVYQEYTNRESLLKKIKAYKKIDVHKARRTIAARKKTVSKKKYSQYKYVAVFLVLLGISSYLYIASRSVVASEIEETLILGDDPITLRLGNGDSRIIVNGNNNQILDSDGKLVGMQEGDKLVYKETDTTTSSVYNTLNIPYGKRFEVVLSDGTKVFLNAGSSLRYPIVFIEGRKREVLLDGEAYFDVTKDDEHPFVVNVGLLNVEVLGTKFIISSYTEDKKINTVLVEGSVSLQYNDKDKILLKPEYKASWDKANKQISIDRVDTNTYTGWMDGKFIFDDLKFKNILEKLERYYNVDIENHYKEMENKRFTSSFEVEEIDKILNVFGVYMGFSYKIKENKIIINPL